MENFKEELIRRLAEARANLKALEEERAILKERIRALERVIDMEERRGGGRSLTEEE